MTVVTLTNARPQMQLLTPLMESVGGIGGISEFVNSIRSMFGRAGEFANRNGSQYSEVYNALLQYSVLHAYMEKKNHRLLVTQTEETKDMNSTLYTNMILEASILAFLIFTFLISLCCKLRRLFRMKQQCSED